MAWESRQQRIARLESGDIGSIVRGLKPGDSVVYVSETGYRMVFGQPRGEPWWVKRGRQLFVTWWLRPLRGLYYRLRPHPPYSDSNPWFE